MLNQQSIIPNALRNQAFLNKSVNPVDPVHFAIKCFLVL